MSDLKNNVAEILYSSHVYNALRVELVARAAGATEQWPQYKGMFDGWRVLRATRKITTKAGVAAVKGDLVLAGYGEGNVVTFYSHRIHCKATVTAKSLEIV